MRFGENLKNLRKIKKLSQEKLAEKVGVSRQSISKWECGYKICRIKNCCFFMLIINLFVPKQLYSLIILLYSYKNSKITLICFSIYI